MRRQVTEIVCWGGFILMLLAFVWVKYPDLSLPYFWDEAGVYAPGALRMKDTSIGLLPGALDPVYSRGHPLLCYATFAAVFKLFGDSVFVGHSLALLIACLTLLSFFLFVKELFGPVAAFLASTLLAVQPMFYAMSGVILPEMMLTLFCLLSIWGLATSRWWLYVLGACLAVLTKEAGLVLPATAVLWVLARSVKEKDLFTWQRCRLLLLAAVPLFLFLVFIVQQRWQHGWFFFPLHTQLMPRTPERIIHKCLVILSMLFREQGRAIWPLLLLVMAVFIRVYPIKDQRIKTSLHLSASFLLLFVVFSATNYYLHRYILPVIPFLVLAVTYIVVSIASRLPWPVIKQAALVVFIAMGIYQGARHRDPGHFSDTNDMSYRQLVLCQKDCIRWAEQQPWADSLVIVNFPVNTGLEDRRMGYLSTRQQMSYTSDLSAHAAYGIYYLQDGALPDLKSAQFRLLKRFQRRDAGFVVVQFL